MAFLRCGIVDTQDRSSYSLDPEIRCPHVRFVQRRLTVSGNRRFQNGLANWPAVAPSSRMERALRAALN